MCIKILVIFFIKIFMNGQAILPHKQPHISLPALNKNAIHLISTSHLFFLFETIFVYICIPTETDT